MANVPKIIHQMWLDEKNAHTPHPPEKYKNYPGYIQRLKDLHPDYTYMWWDRAKCEKLLARTDLAYFRKIYESMPRIIMKCDFMRYVILWLFGGYYFDLDTKFRRRLPEKWENDELGIFHEPPTMTGGKYPHLFEVTGFTTNISNGLLFSQLKHPLWLAVIDEVDKRIQRNGQNCSFDEVIWITGPGMLTAVCMDTGYIKQAKSPCYFFALRHTGERWKCDRGPECENNHYCSLEEAENSIAVNTWNEGTQWYLEDVKIWLAWDLIKAIILTVIICIILWIALWSWPYFTERSINKTTAPIQKDDFIHVYSAKMIT